jgi:hypothetical protein
MNADASVFLGGKTRQREVVQIDEAVKQIA